MLPAARDRRTPRRAAQACATVALAFASVVATLALPAAPAAAVAPATPTGLPAAIEAYQPYVGQQVCDPVAKPGVRAFSTLVLNNYSDTRSLGIVRDCSVGGQSEHKEGRAWDWGVDSTNPKQDAEARELLAWLTATDSAGNKQAVMRRLGIMYMIYNRQIFKAYAAQSGWQPYSGPSPHTEHVHFSFGWAGAKQVTSYWDRTVAPVDYGPAAPAPVVPVAAPANIKVLASYGATTLQQGSSGEAVRTIQRPLRLTADGAYGPATAKAVTAFQRDQGLTADGVFGPDDWAKLFPRPVNPFGKVEVADPRPGEVVLKGWALDAHSSAPLGVRVYVDGVYVKPATADAPRSDVAANYPGLGSAHGFAIPLTLAEGPRKVCVLALNVPGTPGANTSLGCLTVAVEHSPRGGLDTFSQSPSGVRATGWVLDPDTAATTTARLLLDGRLLRDLLAGGSRPDVAARFPAYGDKHGFDVPLDLAQGPHELCLDGVNATGTPGSTSRLGCRRLVVRNDPRGNLDALTTGPGGVSLRGWSLDPNTTAPISVQVRVDGVVVKTVPSSTARSDVAAAYPVYGSARGYSVAGLQLAAGTRQVCTYGLNATGTPGTTGLLACRTVTVRHDPRGNLDSLVSGPGGVSLRGWSLDPDSTASTSVEVYVDGVLIKTVPSTATRSDVAAAYPLYGSARGYSLTGLQLAAGTRKVCTYGLNVSGTAGRKALLACRAVTVRHDPIGNLDSLTSGPGGVSVRGWSLDPDTTAPTSVEVQVDGVLAKTVASAVARSDVAAAYPVYGSARGYAVTGLQLAAGERRVCTYAVNAAGTSGRKALLACRSVLVRHDATGSLTKAVAVPGAVDLAGWALDPDSNAANVVRVFVDAQPVARLTAAVTSTASRATFPLHSPQHGFAGRVAVAKGKHTVCVVSDNVAGTTGRNISLGCRVLTVA